jgi:hypothetical protein
MSRSEKDTTEWKNKWHYIRKSDKPLQKTEALALLDQAGIRYDQPGWSEVYHLIQAILYPEYLIKIRAQHGNFEMLFSTPKMTEQSTAIFFYQEHFDTIKSITGFLRRNFYYHFFSV